LLDGVALAAASPTGDTISGVEEPDASAAKRDDAAVNEEMWNEYVWIAVEVPVGWQPLYHKALVFTRQYLKAKWTRRVYDSYQSYMLEWYGKQWWVSPTAQMSAEEHHCDVEASKARLPASSGLVLVVAVGVWFLTFLLALATTFSCNG
jgi:hypothetical protein